MKNLEAVKWTGYNLKEVIEFTGKHYKFKDWFKSWEEYEKYVEEHDHIFKLFAPNGFSIDVLPETWIVKTPDGFNIPVLNPWLKDSKNNKEDIKLQVAISALQGILEAKHGIVGEIIPSFLVADSFRIADEFVKQWNWSPQAPIDSIAKENKLPKFAVGDYVVSTKNPHLTYKILEVGIVNELGHLDYKVEIFADGKAGISTLNKEHDIKTIEVSKLDEWGKLIPSPSRWTEEDELMLTRCIGILEKGDLPNDNVLEELKWLKDFSNRFSG